MENQKIPPPPRYTRVGHFVRFEKTCTFMGLKLSIRDNAKFIETGGGCEDEGERTFSSKISKEQ